jgi:predicted HD superfamily hydrolase involved in NAD metabolism
MVFMNREAMIDAVRAEMPERRWQHTLGVMESSVLLAERYGADPVRAEQAAILHDVAKYWQTSRLETVIREQKLPADLLKFDKELWHAPVGAFVAEHNFGIADAEILDAIRYHTSGREGMTLMDKIVCLADYIEPGREFPDVHKIRELAQHSLEKALIAGFDSTIAYLLAQGKRIYPLTVAARNDLILFVREAEQ